MSYLVGPDDPEWTCQSAQAAAGALLHIKGCALAVFMKSPSEAGLGAESILAVMTEDRNRGIVTDIMNIDMPTSSVHPLAGDLAGPAANASADININRHL
jgi:hypothetical protein